MRKNVQDPDDLLPLMPAEFQILLALSDGDRHGYGIMEEVRGRTNGDVVLGPGVLYGTLKRLVSLGLVERTEVTPPDRRRYYRLTSLGLRIAQSEARRLAALVGDARLKNLLSTQSSNA